MTSLAAVILAHSDPTHLRRLVGALADIPLFLHCDAKTSRDVATQMFEGLPSRVTPIQRIPTSLASWSLVEAELRALRQALRATDASHIIVASGADYPLVPMSTLESGLKAWTGMSHFWNTPIPYPAWSTRRHPDGGIWRFEHRFLAPRGKLLTVGGIPVRLPVKREIPQGLELRAGSQWKIYAREHARLLLDVVDNQPDLIRFWKTTLVPDESFAASVLSSPKYVGNEGLTPCRASAWFMKWPAGNSDHPAWLDSSHIAAMSAAARAEPMSPEQARLPVTMKTKYQKWFARKFSTRVDTGVLDWIDQHLRSEDLAAH